MDAPIMRRIAKQAAVQPRGRFGAQYARHRRADRTHPWQGISPRESYLDLLVPPPRPQQTGPARPPPVVDHDPLELPSRLSLIDRVIREVTQQLDRTAELPA